MKHKWWRVTLGVVLALSPVSADDLSAAEEAEERVEVTWNQVENIEEAARHIALLQRAQGAQKAVNFIDACYRTHSLASKYSRAYEACIAQDFILAQSLAAIYARMPEDKLKKSGAPLPADITRSMGERVAAAFRHYKVSPKDAVAFRELVATHGVPVYVSIIYPNSQTGADPGAGSKKPDKKRE